MMFAKYFEYYTIILRGAFFRGHAVEQHGVFQHLKHINNWSHVMKLADFHTRTAASNT